MACTAALFIAIPKGFFPTQDTGAIQGIAYAAQDVSPERMRGIQKQLSEVLARDPDIAAFGSFFGNGGYSIWVADTTQQKLRGCITIASGLGSDVTKCQDMTFQ